jgi:hypothetical protein
MEQEKDSTQPEGDSSIVYIIGAIIIVAVIVAGVLLWPKPKAKEAGTETSVVEQKQTITKLGCDTQWYNPKIGFSEYYLSAEGSALSISKTVDCTFTVTSNLDGKVVVTEKIPAVMTNAAERGGQTFLCTTKAIAMPKGTAVTMKTTVMDDLEASAACKPGNIVLP